MYLGKEKNILSYFFYLVKLKKCLTKRNMYLVQDTTNRYITTNCKLHKMKDVLQKNNC